MANELNTITTIESLIHTIRGHRVMLDSDLAKLYGVETKVLNQAVKRNIERFPAHFMFQLTQSEYEDLKVRSQIVTSPRGGGRQYLPYVFTEQGVAMLSSVLKSKKAIQINIQIMDTFVAMRKYAALQTSQNNEIAALRQMLLLHIDNTDNRFAEHEQTIKHIIEALNNLIEKPRDTKQIGFKVEEK